MHEDEVSLREEIVEICRRVHQAGHIAGSDGNVSVRLGSRHLLTTPSGVSKGHLRVAELVKVDLEGRSVGRGRPTSELRLHLLVYARRPEIRAVIHAHPPHAVALSLLGIKITGCLLPETILGLGDIPTAPYATPTTEEVPAAVEAVLGRSHALILARHGSLTLGESLDEAYFRLESLEHAARITCLARAIGPVEPLGLPQMARLEALAQALGRPITGGTCAGHETCPTRANPAPARFPATPGSGMLDEQALIEAVVSRVLERLQQLAG